MSDAIKFIPRNHVPIFNRLPDEWPLIDLQAFHEWRERDHMETVYFVFDWKTDKNITVPYTIMQESECMDPKYMFYESGLFHTLRRR